MDDPINHSIDFNNDKVAPVMHSTYNNFSDFQQRRPGLLRPLRPHRQVVVHDAVHSSTLLRYPTSRSEASLSSLPPTSLSSASLFRLRRLRLTTENDPYLKIIFLSVIISWELQTRIRNGIGKRKVILDDEKVAKKQSNCSRLIKSTARLK